ncbi:MAG: hypothetical protein WDA72_00225 [Desulfomonilia bacterium]|jgi:hypothetical protein
MEDSAPEERFAALIFKADGNRFLPREKQGQKDYPLKFLDQGKSLEEGKRYRLGIGYARH